MVSARLTSGGVVLSVAREALALMVPPPGLPAVQWRISDSAIPYTEAVAWMDQRAGDIAAGQAPETVWLLSLIHI